MARLRIERRVGVRVRFIVLILLIMVSVFAVFTAILVQRNTNTLQDELAARSKAFASLATSPIGDTFVIYKDSGLVQIQSQMRKFTDLNKDIVNVAVVDTTGTVLFSQHDAYDTAKVSAEAAGSFEPTYLYDEQANLSQIVYPYLENFGLRRYSLVYWVSSEGIALATRQIIISLSLLGLLGMLVAALTILLSVNRFLLKPIQTISRSSLAISGGRLDEKISLTQRDELGDLATSINTMADSLKRDIEKLQVVDKMKSEFMAIASHNLRTPLTVMRGNIDMLREEELDEQKQSFVDALAAGADRLRSFTNDMITISELEAGNYEKSMKRTPIAAIADTLAQDFEPLAKTKHLDFSYTNTAGERAVTCSKTYLQSALWSVLDNALKFTPKDGKVTFTVLVESGQIVLVVADTGSGIAADEQARLFTKFHRATDVMRYDYEGTGLGLYLAKLAIDLHHGDIRVESKVDEGTTVTITLPLASGDDEAAVDN